MTELARASEARAPATQSRSAAAILRFFVIALTAFLTVVDLFATQAILPSLTRHYGVTPAAMGFAVNASTRAWRYRDSLWAISAARSIEGKGSC